MLFSKIEGKGKPFLIIHGFLGMSDNWKTLGEIFSFPFPCDVFMIIYLS